MGGNTQGGYKVDAFISIHYFLKLMLALYVRFLSIYEDQIWLNLLVKIQSKGILEQRFQQFLQLWWE